MRTRVGYCGGTRPNPTYHSIGDHSESIQIDFDPKVISYAQLLREAMSQGNFGGSAYSRQYRSAVFYGTAEQKATAESAGCSSIEPLGVFTRAEDYHQKYYLQQSGVVKDFYAMFPDDASFTDSTSTMRANAIVAGCLPRDRVEGLLPGLGVSSATGQKLLQLAGTAAPGCAAP